MSTPKRENDDHEKKHKVAGDINDYIAKQGRGDENDEENDEIQRGVQCCRDGVRQFFTRGCPDGWHPCDEEDN